MLQFLYTDDYALDNHQSICTCDYSWPSGYNECLLCHELKNAGAQGICHFNVLMYIQADYFHIETLKLKALKRFQSYFQPFPAFTQRSFEAVVMEIYDRTAEDDPIRAQLVTLTAKNSAVLKGKGNIINRTFLERFPVFAVDLCLASLDR